jgi:hypothetical protein
MKYGVMVGNILTTTSQVIEALGGSARVAVITGRKVNAASNWLKFETFPSDTFLVMQQALMATGYTAPASLWAMVEPERMMPVGRPKRQKRRAGAHA